MNTDTRQELMGVSTATLCTAFFKRSLARQLIPGLYPPTDEQSRLDFAAWRKVKGR